jgi:hypothetical protein
MLLCSLRFRIIEDLKLHENTTPPGNYFIISF